MVAYAVTRMRWKLRGTAYWFFMAGLTIPIHATLLPLFLLLKRIGILNTPLAIIIPYTAFALPFGIMVWEIIMRQFPMKWKRQPVLTAAAFTRRFFSE